MDSTVLPLIIGISSSLIATAIFILSSEFFRKMLIPWFSDKIYRGVRVEGDWTEIEFNGQRTDINRHFSRMNLSQSSNRIKGLFISETPEMKENYRLTGVVRDMHLTLTAVPISDRTIDSLCLLLQISDEDNSLAMKGGLLCQDGPVEIAHHKIKFTSKKS